MIGNTNETSVFINGNVCKALLDTESTVSTVSESYYREFLGQTPIQTLNNLLEIESASGDQCPYIGYIEVQIQVTSISSDPLNCLVLVVPDTRYNCHVPLLIGTNVLKPLMVMCEETHGQQFMQKTNLDTSWCLSFRCISYQDKQLKRNKGVVGEVKAPYFDKIIVQGNKSVVVECPVNVQIPFRPCTVLMQAVQNTLLPKSIEITCGLLNFVPGRTVTVPVRISNLVSSPISINSKTILGELRPVVYDTNDENTAAAVNMSVNTGEEECNKNFVSTPDTTSFIDNIKFGTSLSSNELGKVKEFLVGWSKVFSQNETDIGLTHLVKHQIFLKDYTPFKQRFRRIPPSCYNEVREHLHQLVQEGVIRKSKSLWCSNVVLVRKKDKSLRLCVDYRMLNNRTIKDSYALPRIEEILDCLGGYKYFSVLDMKSGYYQVEIQEEHKPYTAFTVGPLGLWEYNRLAMGLTNSPATYQRLVEECLGDLNYKVCLIYLDDLIIFSDTVEEHLKRLDQVFSRIAKAGMKFSPKKCHIMKDKIKYVGHVISSAGIETDPDKINKVLHWPRPSDRNELRKFLGFAGYYRKFIRGFASVAKPLYELLSGIPRSKKKGSKNQQASLPIWHWGEAQENAFSSLKTALTTPPVLGFTDYTLPFELHIDASRTGLSGILYQTQNGRKQVLSFASRSLSPSEKNILLISWNFVH